MTAPIQYPLPFVPPLAQWLQHEASLALELAIDRALWVASMDAAWGWSARSFDRADIAVERIGEHVDGRAVRAFGGDGCALRGHADARCADAISSDDSTRRGTKQARSS